MSGRGGSGRGALLRSLGSTDEDGDSHARPSVMDSGLGLGPNRGRGRLLLGLIGDSDNQPSTSNTPSHEASSQEASGVDSAFLLKLTSGRGRILQTSTNTPSQDENASLSHGTSGIEASFLPQPTSGRGRMMQLLQEGNMRNVSSGVDFGDSVESVTQEVAEMNVQVVETEQEPVIRRGTRGLSIDF